MTHLAKATNLYQMVFSHQLLEGFEKYYHQNVIKQEIGEAPREGKGINREYSEKFMAMIKEFHGGGILGITANEAENKTMVESWMDITLQDDSRIKIEQVAVQTWEGDYIVKEVFYHK